MSKVPPLKSVAEIIKKNDQQEIKSSSGAISECPLLGTDKTFGGINNNEKYDVEITISAKKYPDLAKHIRYCQDAGYPKVLTLNRGRKVDLRRSKSLKGVPRFKGTQRDEYPPAMFEEGGNNAHIWHIDPTENCGAGARMGNLLRRHKNGTKVKITIVDI